MSFTDPKVGGISVRLLAKSVAVIQIIFFSGGLLLLGVMVGIIFSNREEFETGFRRELGESGVKVTFALASFYVVLMTCLAHSAILGILTGLALLKGVVSKNNQLMKMWGFFAVGSMFLGLVAVVISFILTRHWIAAFIGVLGYSLFTPALWVVYKYEKGLQEQRALAGLVYKVQG